MSASSLILFKGVHNPVRCQKKFVFVRQSWEVCCPSITEGSFFFAYLPHATFKTSVLSCVCHCLLRQWVVLLARTESPRWDRMMSATTRNVCQQHCAVISAAEFLTGEMSVLWCDTACAGFCIWMQSTSAWLCVHACVCVHIRMHVCIKWFQSFKPVMQGNQNHRAWFALWFGENHIFWELLPPAYQTQAFQTRLNLLRNVVKKTLSHDGYLQFAYVYTEGQNHRMVWVGGDWKGLLITAPCRGMLLSTVSVVASQWSSRQKLISFPNQHPRSKTCAGFCR